MTQTFDRTADLVIVGSGAGALVAAVTAKAAGLEPLIVEKTELVGGAVRRALRRPGR